MWRCRNSAVANRRALHSDYTSATEKTLTPLNGACTRRAKIRRSVLRSMRDAIARRRSDTHACDERRAQILRLVENPDGIWHFRAISRDAEFVARASTCRSSRARCMRKRRKRTSLWRFCPSAKIFFHRAPKSALRGCWIRSKTRKSGRSVIRCRALRDDAASSRCADRHPRDASTRRASLRRAQRLATAIARGVRARASCAAAR